MVAKKSSAPRAKRKAASRRTKSGTRATPKAAAESRPSARAKPSRASEPKAKPSAKSRAGITLDDVRALALALPGSEEGTSYGTPAWRVRGKLFARIHDSRVALMVRIDLDERELAMASDPDTYFITDHYRDHPAMLVHLGHATRTALAEALEASWRRMAPRRLISELDARG